MDPATITLIIGIISCVIGVSTFVNGRMAKAEHNGSMETKISQALDGITAINRKLEEFSDSQHEVELLVRSHEEQIHTLFESIGDMKNSITTCSQTQDILKDLVHTLRRIEEK